MDLYPHWLDGEYLRLTRDDVKLRGDFVEPMMKAHAILGNSLVLSDIQIVDSSLLQELFYDSDFRRFLSDNPDFLALSSHVVLPTGADAAAKRFALVTRGAVRATANGWTSSTFDPPDPIVELCQRVLDQRTTDVGDLKAWMASQLHGWREHQVALEGVMWSLDHFATTRGVRVLPSSTAAPRSYYDVLIDLHGRTGLNPADARLIEAAVTHIDARIAVEDRPRRAALKSQLGQESTWTLEYRRLWGTAVQAWNVAVQETLAPHGASIARLPGAASVGLYSGVPTDALFDEPTSADLADLSMPGLAIDHIAGIARLDWRAVNEVVKRTRESALRYQNAIADGDHAAAHEYLRKHTSAIRQRMLVDSFETPGIIWAGLEAMTGLGFTPFSKYAPLPGISDALRRQLLHSFRRFRVANTVAKIGEQWI